MNSFSVWHWLVLALLGGCPLIYWLINRSSPDIVNSVGPLNAKIERIHKVISFAYFAFAGIGLLLVILNFSSEKTDEFRFGLACIFGAGPIGFFHWYASKGARVGSRWGRNMSRGFGILALFGFPLGTILGVYILSQTGAKWQTNSLPGSGS